jgi:hypothetical protein
MKLLKKDYRKEQIRCNGKFCGKPQFSLGKFYGITGHKDDGMVSRGMIIGLGVFPFPDKFHAVCAKEFTEANGWDTMKRIEANNIQDYLMEVLKKDFYIYEFDSERELFDWLVS